MKQKPHQHNIHIGRVKLPHQCTPKITRIQSPAYTTEHAVEEKHDAKPGVRIMNGKSSYKMYDLL